MAWGYTPLCPSPHSISVVLAPRGLRTATHFVFKSMMLALLGLLGLLGRSRRALLGRLLRPALGLSTGERRGALGEPSRLVELDEPRDRPHARHRLGPHHVTGLERRGPDALVLPRLRPRRRPRLEQHREHAGEERVARARRVDALRLH